MATVTEPNDASATRPPPARALRFRRLDPLVPLTALVAAVVYLSNGLDGALTRDVAVYSYGGQQVAEGVAPYVAIINRAGPLAHLVPGIGAWVSRQMGVDDLLGMRVLFLVLSAAAVAACYLLGRDLFRSRGAGVAAAGALLALNKFSYYASNGPREKTTMVLLVVVALIALAHRRWATAGALIALATLTWQPVLFGGLAAAVVTALLQRRGRLRSLLLVAVGGLVPLAVTVGGYALIGHLQMFWDDFLLINLHYTRQSSPIDRPAQAWQSLVDGYGWGVWVLLGGLLLQLVWAGRALGSPDRREALPAAQAGLGAFTLVSIAWSLKAFNGSPDAFVLVPGVVVGVAGVVPLLARRLPGRLVVAAVAAWSVAVTALAVDHALTSRSDELLVQRHDVASVVAALPPGSRILSVGVPQALVLAHMRNPSRFQLLDNGLMQYLAATWPGGVQGYARWIREQAPAVITTGLTNVRWLSHTLAADYVLVGTSPTWTWYVRADVGKSTLQRVRVALSDQ